MTNRIIHFSKKLTEKNSQIFDNTRRNIVFSLINYIIDSKFRKAVFLTNWLRSSVNEALANEDFIKISDGIKLGSNDDETIFNCLKWVINNIKYVGDYIKWDMNEKWQTPIETFSSRTGDCEDMHILVYALARSKGIIADKMLLWCGNVQSSPTAPLGGHCSLLYKPLEYPLNFVWLDACYYPNLQPVFNRNLIFLDGKEIEEFVNNPNNGWLKKDSYYKASWFVFNESFSSNGYTFKV